MSETKYPLARAGDVAGEVLELLMPYCHQIEIAGSVRRKKPFVSDIEILYRPKEAKREVFGDMFATEYFYPVNDLINQLLTDGIISKRPNVAGGFTWGRLNKLAIHGESGIPLDLFCEPVPHAWGRSLVIRTGPKELNISLITAAAARGIKLHAYGEPATEADSPTIVLDCTTEQQVFDLCGVPYIHPEDR